MEDKIKNSKIFGTIIELMSSINELKDVYNTDLNVSLLKKVVSVSLNCPEKPEGYELEVKSIAKELDSICLTSGGADSTIMWYKANQPKGLYINLGQSYAEKEMKCLDRLGVDYIRIDLSEYNLVNKTWKHIIPLRNLLFLTIAGLFLKDGGTVYFSMLQGEGADSGRGDKSWVFIDSFLEWFKSVTGKTIKIETLVDNTKAGWLKWFMNNGYDSNIIRHNSVTCFNGGEIPCGVCQACFRKFVQFVYNGIDISEDFRVHPIIGGKEYIEKYKVVMGEALRDNDFSHHSKQRCEETLSVIKKYENLLCGSRTRKV